MAVVVVAAADGASGVNEAAGCDWMGPNVRMIAAADPSNRYSTMG